jgi:hypothetical protein
MKRSHVVVIAAVILAAGVVSGVVVQATHSNAATIGHAFPEPGSIAASPQTAITVRGISAKQVGHVAVTGAVSGKHTGKLSASRDGDGATFTPDTPFQAGEKVTVHTDGKVSGAHKGTFAFTVAHLAKPATAPSTPGKTTTSSYHSAPDLNPPALSVKNNGTVFNGLLASAPDEGADGLLLSDESGQPVWFQPAAPGHVVGDLHVATYKGKQVLVYFDGTEGFGAGNYRGSWHMLNSSYQQIATISAGNGAKADLHDILLRKDGTAVVEAYDPVVMDMRKYGGKKRATVLDCEIQQIDIASGAVLFEWHSLDHLRPAESYADLTGSVVDYFHANTLAADPRHPNNVIVSSRHLSQVFSLNVKTGKIGWRVGGKHPTLTLTKGAVDTLDVNGQQLPFSYQHDARLQADGTLTVYDNGNQRSPHPFSRAASFTLDLRAHTVTENNGRELRHKPDLYGDATGDFEHLPNGDTFVSWGTTGKATEYNGKGQPVSEITTPMTYRMLKAPWHATPKTRPALATAMRSDSRATVYASWNGATEVASWQVLAGSSSDNLRVVATARRSGFETAITLPAAASTGYVRIRAVNAAGTALKDSATTRIVQP